MTKSLLAVLLATLVTLLSASPARAQRLYLQTLNCQGVFQGDQVTLKGQRQYAPYNALGDAQVRFYGILKSRTWTSRMTYEGYTRNMPYDGFVEVKRGWLHVEVLDSTGDYGEQMIIYDGRPTLKATEVFGRLVCRWSNVSNLVPSK